MRRTRLTLLFLILFLVLPAFAPSGPQAAALGHRVVGEEQLGEGTYLYRYELFVEGRTLRAQQIVVDLTNPYAEVRAVSPVGGFNSRETVRSMVDRTGAVAGINADLFHLTRPAAPFGPHVENGRILSSPTANPYSNAFGIDSGGTAHIRNWAFRGTLYLGGSNYPLDGYNQTYQNNLDGIFLYDRNWGGQISSSFFTGPVVAVTVVHSRVTRLDITADTVSVPTDGYVLLGEGRGGEFLNAIARIGTPVDFDLALNPPMDLRTAVGAHCLIVDGGRPLGPDQLASPGSTRASRTAVGIDAGGRTLRLVTIDGNATVAGLTMSELALFMSEIGSYRALNLDGGGSTSMAGRRLGEFQSEMIGAPRTGFERAIPNAIGIYNVAPASAPDRLFLRGPAGMLADTEAAVRVTGHDAHYLPLRIDADTLRWDVSNPAVAEVISGKLVAKAPGETQVRVSLGSIHQSMDVRVFGGADIAEIRVNPADVRLLSNQRVALSARVVTKSGITLDAGPGTISWRADFGRVEGNTYYAPAEEGFGTLIAEIDGHIQEVPIRVGGRREPFFTFRDWQTATFRSHPEGLPGSFDIITDPAFIFRGERSGRLRYDFSGESTGTMIAYAQLGSGQISMGTNNVGVSAYVLGDRSGYELRGEIVDGNGQSRYVVLSESIDWEGWRRVQGAIDPNWPQPLILSSLYLLREGPSGPRAGTIYLDQIEMIKGLESDAGGELADVKMWVGSTEYTIRGQSATMDAAPFIASSRTLIPVRYLAEAFEARVDWTTDPGTGRTSTVTLTGEEIAIVIEIGLREMTVVNRAAGWTTVYPLDVAPVIVEGRTYLPFRAIGELGFGATVDYSLHPDTGAVDSVWLNRN